MQHSRNDSCDAEGYSQWQMPLSAEYVPLVHYIYRNIKKLSLLHTLRAPMFCSMVQFMGYNFSQAKKTGRLATAIVT
jgi:hypothetical protein